MRMLLRRRGRSEGRVGECIFGGGGVGRGKNYGWRHLDFMFMICMTDGMVGGWRTVSCCFFWAM